MIQGPLFFVKPQPTSAKLRILSFFFAAKTTVPYFFFFKIKQVSLPNVPCQHCYSFLKITRWAFKETVSASLPRWARKSKKMAKNIQNTIWHEIAFHVTQKVKFKTQEKKATEINRSKLNQGTAMSDKNTDWIHMYHQYGIKARASARTEWIFTFSAFCQHTMTSPKHVIKLSILSFR